jgi:uncharacterized protein (TIGR02271 family)
LAYEEHDDRSPEAGRGLAGYQVYDQHYEKIGKVDDLFVDESDRPEYIGVKMGFLGTKSTLIPIEIVRVNDKRELVEVAADKDVVKEGPTFGDDREITPGFERRVLNYYQVETAQTFTERGAYGAYYPGTTGDDRVDLQPGERAEGRERSGERRSGATTGGEDRERGEFREREELRQRPASREHQRKTERGRDPGDEDELRVQRVEEELRAETREREAGGMNVRKRVRTEREQVRVPKRREEVHLERVPVEEREASEVEGRGSSGAEIGEDEIRIPVIEEEVVVEKRPVVREEIRLRKEVVEEEEVIEEDVRKEEVDIEDRTERRRNG